MSSNLSFGKAVIRGFANKLATEIMTVSDPRQPNGERVCDRAVMMSNSPDGEVDMGGRCHASIAQVIEEALTREL